MPENRQLLKNDEVKEPRRLDGWKVCVVGVSE